MFNTLPKRIVNNLVARRLGLKLWRLEDRAIASAGGDTSTMKAIGCLGGPSPRRV